MATLISQTTFNVITYIEMSDFRYMRYFQRFNFCALSTLCDGSFSSTSIKYHSYSMPTPYTDIDSDTRCRNWKMPVATCKLQIEIQTVETLFSILNFSLWCMNNSPTFKNKRRWNDPYPVFHINTRYDYWCQ